MEHFACRASTPLAHGNPDVSSLECGSIVNPIRARRIARRRAGAAMAAEGRRARERGCSQAFRRDHSTARLPAGATGYKGLVSLQTKRPVRDQRCRAAQSGGRRQEWPACRLGCRMAGPSRCGAAIDHERCQHQDARRGWQYGVGTSGGGGQRRRGRRAIGRQGRRQRQQPLRGAAAHARSCKGAYGCCGAPSDWRIRCRCHERKRRDGVDRGRNTHKSSQQKQC